MLTKRDGWILASLFFAFWLTLTSSRSCPTLEQRLFTRGFRFRSSLKKWPARKACVHDKRDGWILAKLVFAFSQIEIPWVPEVFSRGFAARVLGLRPTKLVVARKNKPLVPRASRSLKTRKKKKKLGQYPAITLINNACCSRLTWPKPETAHEKPLAHRVGPRRDQGQSKRKKARPMSCHLDRTSVVNKGYIIRSKGELFLAAPMRKAANQKTGFASSCFHTLRIKGKL